MILDKCLHEQVIWVLDVKETVKECTAPFDWQNRHRWTVECLVDASAGFRVRQGESQCWEGGWG